MQQQYMASSSIYSDTSRCIHITRGTESSGTGSRDTESRGRLGNTQPKPNPAVGSNTPNPTSNPETSSTEHKHNPNPETSSTEHNPNPNPEASSTEHKHNPNPEASSTEHAEHPKQPEEPDISLGGCLHPSTIVATSTSTANPPAPATGREKQYAKQQLKSGTDN